ncbi:MAG: RidA family protein [Acholeplasmatales bacterium]|nr:RidA family protein [Acholeplasmatales bacterium]
MSQCNLKSISTNEAPLAVGPYSQAIICNDLVFISGQIPIDPKTNQLSNDNFENQVKLVFNNISAILKEANSSLDKVVKTTVFIKDISKFGAFNEIYATYFINNKPARSLVEVSNLPKGALVEVEVIAKI